MIDLNPNHLATVQRILAEHVPECEVRAFGSRATWTAKDYSDIDLAIVGEGPLEWRTLGRLKEAFEESSLPMRVDVLDWHDISENFRKVIEQDYVVVQRGTKKKVHLAGSASAGSPSGAATLTVSAGNWREVTIEEIAEKVAMGPFGSSIKVETFVSEGVPVISGQHLHGFRVDDAPGFNFISPEHAQRLANANVHRGDVVFTHAGNIGQAAYIPESSKFECYVISQRQFYLRCDRSKALPEFVTLYFRSPEGQHKLLANASQVGVPSIAQPVTYLRTIEIPPPAPPRTAGRRPCPWHAGRQDRAEPPHERDAGGDGAGAVQVVVCRLRAGAGQDGGPLASRRVAARPPRRHLRPLPGPDGGLGAGGDPGGVGGKGV